MIIMLLMIVSTARPAIAAVAVVAAARLAGPVPAGVVRDQEALQDAAVLEEASPLGALGQRLRRDVVDLDQFIRLAGMASHALQAAPGHAVSVFGKA